MATQDKIPSNESEIGAKSLASISPSAMNGSHFQMRGCLLVIPRQSLAAGAARVQTDPLPSPCRRSTQTDHQRLRESLWLEFFNRNRGRLRHNGLSRRAAGRLARHRDDQPLRLGRRPAGAPSRRSPTTPASTSACGPRKAARPPRSPRSATSSPSTSRCSTQATRSSRSTSPPGSRGPSRPPARPASDSIDEGKGGERIHVLDSRSAAGGMGLCAARGRRSGRDRRHRAGRSPGPSKRARS